MSTKHTPGPWNAIEPNQEDRCYIETRKDGTLVAFVEGDAGCSYTDAANAARIVACVNACEGIADPSVVPDLLLALKAVVKLMRPGDAADVLHDNFRDLIAKAEGGKK